MFLNCLNPGVLSPRFFCDSFFSGIVPTKLEGVDLYVNRVSPHPLGGRGAIPFINSTVGPFFGLSKVRVKNSGRVHR